MKLSVRQSLTLAVSLCVVWGLAFSQSLMSMEAIWRRSDTFAHGYFILPIVCWLIWRDKDKFSLLNMVSSSRAIICLIPVLFIGLLSYAADIAVISQLAAIAAFIALIWGFFGSQILKTYKFPLAYLFFMVPMGENLIPWLQDVTASITVFLLGINGIPVFRDGLYLQTPTGLFEVAVACSGIRYLIASFAVGTLFAFLSYRSFKKQLLFSIFALLLPIIANGIRAYIIVAIAHYSDMKYATGADHLVYGWVFFGFVIMLMFWIGGKFADPENSDSEQVQKKYSGSHTIALTPVIASSMCIALFLAAKLNIPLTSVPETPSNAIENLADASQSNWGIQFNHSQQLTHGRQGELEIFAAIYANRQEEGELINSQNNLYDPNMWTVVERVAFEFDGHKARYLLLRTSSGRERSILYWYQVGDNYFVSAPLAKLAQAWQLITLDNSYSGVVAFSLLAPEDDPQSKLVELSKQFLEADSHE